MPAYCVYGDLDDSFKDVCMQMRITDKDVLHWTMDEEPHITIMYGPLIKEGEPEITQLEKADEVLGGFVERFKGRLPEFKVVGISHFDSDPRFNVIKIELESQEMTDMQIYLRENTNNNYAEMFEQRKSESYAMPPKRWCHVTIGYVKKSLPIQPIIDSCTERLKSFKVLDKTLKVGSISLITAVTDKRIVLWS